MNAESKVVPAKRVLKSEPEEDEAPAVLPPPKPGFLPTGLSRAIVLGSLILGVFAATLIFSHRFVLIGSQRGENAVAYRLDTLTGRIAFCSSVSCVPVTEKVSGD